MNWHCCWSKCFAGIATLELVKRNLSAGAPAAPVQIERAEWSSLDASRQKAVTRLYEELLPAEQRYDVARFGEEGAATWLAVNAENVVIGFANTMNLPRSQSVLLRYLGVESRLQSSGVGTALLGHLVDAYERQGSRAIFIEVEEPDTAEPESPDARRLRFYSRWGAAPVQCISHYYMADCSRWGQRLPMRLLWRPVAGGAEPCGQRLGAALADIFEREYAAYADPDFLSDLKSFVVC
jgi:GNAT superfamily N-acetyltransferase